MKKVGTIFRESLTNRIKESVNNNSNVFLLSYSGISGLKKSNLRKDLKKIGAEVYVTKNPEQNVECFSFNLCVLRNLQT